MKTLSAIALATAMTVGGASVAAAQEMNLEMESAPAQTATSEQIEMANTAQIVEVDEITFDADSQNISELRQAVVTNPSLTTQLENNNVDQTDIVDVAYNDQGTLVIYINQTG